MNGNVATPSNEKIREALELLRQAAVEKKEELRGMVGDQYGDLRDVIGGFGATVANRARSAVDSIMRAKNIGNEKVKDAALCVDEAVHEKPYHFLGGVAIAALILGYMIGRR
jgi:ElaB/YqjD/DUF883 family membrane-anchored ribosome-binding protein